MLQSSLWGRAEAGHLPEATRCLVPFFLPSLPFSHPLTSFSWEHFFLGKSFAQERNLHLKVSFQATPSETALFFLNSLNKYEHCHSATMTPPPQPTPQARAVWSFQENASLVCVHYTLKHNGQRTPRSKVLTEACPPRLPGAPDSHRQLPP